MFLLAELGDGKAAKRVCGTRQVPQLTEDLGRQVPNSMGRGTVQAGRSGYVSLPSLVASPCIVHLAFHNMYFYKPSFIFHNPHLIVCPEEHNNLN